MTVLQLGLFALIACGIGRLKKGREVALLGTSVFVIYWLQPPQQFISLAFWLPTTTIALIVGVWILLTPPEQRRWNQNWSAAFVILGVILLVDLNQFFGLEKIYMTTTPRLWMIAGGLVVYALFLLALAKFSRLRDLFVWATLFLILLALVTLKSPALVSRLFELAYALRAQPAPDSRIIFSWLGYSYVAFRLVHTIRESQAGRLAAIGLGEYVTYVIFYPSFNAGPIDRAERFVPDLRKPVPLTEQDWLEAGTRLFTGLFKKFVIADTLSWIAINDVLVGQVHSAGWLWFFLYMYSLRIYFDFSGYTDVAIGIARVMGVRLPENFAAPYLKPNLAGFWNSWHMTLTQWFRTYYFNPLTRTLRTGNARWPAAIVIFVTQISTMILIGLWHGITWGFFAWGVWHGVGLFIQNRWSEFMRTRQTTPVEPRSRRLLDAVGILVTFNFVSLGWLFFTLSTPSLAWQALLKLFGLVT